MLIDIAILAVLLVLATRQNKQLREARRDIRTLFLMHIPAPPAELDSTHDAADVEDRVRRIVDEHVDRYHRR